MMCPRCQQENPPEARFCMACGAGFSARAKRGKAEAVPRGRRKPPKSEASQVEDFEKRLAEALQREAEASKREAEGLEQQRATENILRVISHSPTDAQPVFDAIAESAARLTGAVVTSVYEFDGSLIHLRVIEPSDYPHREYFRRNFPRPPAPDFAAGRVILGRALLHRADLQNDPDTPELTRDWARRMDLRSVLWVPMLREGQPLGVIGAVRREGGLFADDEVRLLQTFADQAVIAIENVRLFNETKEALEQQTATSEILRVISGSPTDLQPVMDTIAEHAARLCEASDAQIFRLDGGAFHLAASHGPLPPARQVPVTRGSVAGRAVIDRRTVHIRDIATEPGDEFPDSLAKGSGLRTLLAVALLREGVPIGAVVIRRMEVRPFSDKHIELLQTFADQAVIAIENVRLFKELEARNAALTESLDQQTATADILGVISSSPTDMAPVFNTILASATRLCEASFAVLFLYDGEALTVAAHQNASSQLIRHYASGTRVTPSMQGPARRAALLRETVHIADMTAEPGLVPIVLTEEDVRTVLAVPLLREGALAGVIAMWRREVRPFTDKQVALVRTFADQAVIAIENVRLFRELQEKNNALTAAHAQVTEALEQQTATSEILSVISGSPTDIQPVFDTIVKSVARLCDGMFASLHRLDGDLLHWVAQHNYTAEGLEAMRKRYPMLAGRDTASGRALIDRTVIHIRDFESDPDAPPSSREIARAFGYRSLITVPMLREGQPVGAIAVARRDGPFSAGQIALLKTFADQAVIAIENVRLFKELEARTQDLTRSVGELRALGDVGQAISSTLDLRTVLSTIVARATQLSGTDAGVIYEYDEQREVFVPHATEHLEAEIVETMLATPVRKGEGATGQLAQVQEPIQVPDILVAPTESRVRGALVRAGYRALLAVPLLREDHLLGGLTVIRKATGAFAPETIELLRTFATQSALAIQNARLFSEIEDKSRQLEAASQHKSEFLANMSHELRTPLNAIIGFSEVLSERMFGELNEKQDEYLKDIHASGQHLLSLINDILDLSKIEAGRMELELSDFSLPATLDNALTLVRERAARHGIALQVTTDDRVGQVRADERKIRQVILNLLSNAIKFTPEGGRIDVGAGPGDGVVEVSVSDTGVGIAPEDQEAIFEEFRQVGTAAKKVEGTGLGLALSRKFIELHGGRIWVHSQVGEGSRFTFTIPVRRGE